MNVGYNPDLFNDSKENLSKNGQRLDPGVIEYLKYTRFFTKLDWIKYILWVGMMASLAVATLTFLTVGALNGASFPAYVWWIPISVIGFTIVISLDNIAHTVIYKDWISQSELTIHKFTTASGIGATVTLILGYHYPKIFFIPILVLIGLSIVYSLIDEGIHWIRYARGGSGIVEVTCHFFILVFHSIMSFVWLQWYLEGYAGVEATLAVFGA